jgi:phenylacetate-CoA ligase
LLDGGGSQVKVRAVEGIELSVLVPCFNEANNLPELAQRVWTTLERVGLIGEIVLIDDGSTDETAAVIRQLAKSYPNVKGVFHQSNQGIVSCWKDGLEAAQGRYVAVIDADLQYQPEDIARLYGELTFAHSDLVIGARSPIGPWGRRHNVWRDGLAWLLSFLFGTRFKDPKTGFFLCPWGILADILGHRDRYRLFQTFVTVAAVAKGYTVREIEVLYTERRVGTSFVPHFPLRLALVTLGDLPRAFAEFRLRRTTRQTVLAEFLNEHPPQREPDPLSWWRRLWFRLYIVLMPLHHWVISRDAAIYYQELRRSQWLTMDEIRELQQVKLRKLIVHAYNHVPFYRERMDALGLRPESIRTLADLHKLPLLSKDDIRSDLYFGLMSDNYDRNRILRITTSGSTGEPLVTYADKAQLEIRWATTLRNIEWTGYRFGDRQVRLWHQTLGMSPVQVVKEWLDACLSRRRFIPVFKIGDDNLMRFARQIERYNPTLIDGYAEALNLLALFLRTRGVIGIRPGSIISSAQTLSSKSRETIEAQFNCRVFDKYGSREFSGIAHECAAHAGLHVNAESYIVEILRDGQPVAPGETGEVVITDLNNYVLPLIRYRLGDLAVAADDAPCACGRGLPRIAEVRGRVQAIIIGTNKRYLPGTFFAHFIKDYDHAIRQFQVIQEELGRVTLKIVKAPRYTPGVLEDILDVLHVHLGADMQIDVEFVDAIALGRTGKHYHSISRVEVDFQDGKIG